ncbi:PepSY-associated TM helix domain-containing protein [Thauera mechernichensis]|uniref:PepSY-associated TM helix domain-containing protein n=1 Tax=Thauera mechernichensis TaxID=82788 RepID=A0ABW3WD87_9RHOO|nr:PepSY-associated TM helix domain-containing protein [Thauera mechernichensis]MDG3065005.1 PepSY-associated TM helix domain-containing protein [Thauera mechernichensis]
MKDGFRQCMAWLHTWVGLVAGWVLFFVFVTGTAGYFDDEIDRWMKPELPLSARVEVGDRAAMLERALDRLESVAPGAKEWTILLPGEAVVPRGARGLAVRWEEMPEFGRDQGRRGSEGLDAESGEPVPDVEPRATRGGQLLYRMHYLLHYMPTTVGILLVGVCTMMMLIAILSGVVTHKQIFKDFFTFRPGKGQRSWLDAHNVVSVMALPFFLMITYSGLILFPVQYMPGAIYTVYGGSEQGVRAFSDQFFEVERDRSYEPLQRPHVALDAIVAQAEAQWGDGQVAALELSHPVDAVATVTAQRRHGSKIDFREPESLRFAAHTGEPLAALEPRHAVGQTRNVLYALHEGLFAGPWLRWVYFGSGLLGCAMIATGLVLWTVKRRKRHHKQGANASAFDAAGLRLVEVLNAGTIAGLPVAVAAYFWANRLLPLDMADRAQWEAHMMFAVWGWLFIYASLRPLRRAWVEILWLAALAYALLPVLNAATTDRHLGVTLPHGDWVLAGFDLIMIGLAAVFIYILRKLDRRWTKGEVTA